MRLFTIGRLSALSGVHVETIRFYERSGLIPEPARSAGGRRLYDIEASRRLKFVRRARELGFALDDIRALLGLEEAPPTCASAYEIAARNRSAVRTKISDLRRLDRRLTAIMNDCTRQAAPKCALFEALARD
ncbi:MAG: MerR family transcriptional regulator [Parvularculaceae bacterium]